MDKDGDSKVVTHTYLLAWVSVGSSYTCPVQKKLDCSPDKQQDCLSDSQLALYDSIAQDSMSDLDVENVNDKLQLFLH